MTIRFTNNTDNFNPTPSAFRAPIDRMAFFTTKVNTFDGNRRMNLPDLLMHAFNRPKYIQFSLEENGTIIYVDLIPQDVEDRPEGAVIRKVINTGRAYFVNIPRKWIAPHLPNAAQLFRSTKPSKYRVNLYETE